MNFASIKIVTIFVYVSFLVFLVLGLVGYTSAVYIYISMLFVVEIYLSWILLVFLVLTKQNNIENRKFVVISLACMLVYMLGWILFRVQENSVDRITYDQLDNFLGAIGFIFYVCFIYINVKLSKRLVYIESLDKKTSKKYVPLFLMLIIFPILSFPVLHHRVYQTKTKRVRLD